MSSFTLQASTALPFADAVQAVREELAQAKFGVLTEIDLAATLKAKIGAEIAPEVILGACSPGFALAAVQTDPSIAALLPCNVVIRQGTEQVELEAFDPAAMARLSSASDAGLASLAGQVRELLQGVLDAVAARAA